MFAVQLRLFCTFTFQHRSRITSMTADGLFEQTVPVSLQSSVLLGKHAAHRQELSDQLHLQHGRIFSLQEPAAQQNLCSLGLEATLKENCVLREANSFCRGPIPQQPSIRPSRTPPELLCSELF